MQNALKLARLNNKFTQSEAASFLNVSLRSYKSYELDNNKQNTIKYDYMVNKLNENCFVDEEHGLLNFENIVGIVQKICNKNSIRYCYLFGSYAKGKENEKSDVDLLISSDIDGMSFYGLVEELRNELHKKVDLLDTRQLNNNPDLLDEILKDGIKIYNKK